MFDISKYYDLGKLEFIGDKRHFEDALKVEAIKYCKKDSWYKRCCGSKADTLKIVLDNKATPYKIYGENVKKIIREIRDLGKRLGGIKKATDRYPALIDDINEAIADLDISNNEEALEILRPKLKRLKGFCSESIHDENPYDDILDKIRRLINSIYLKAYIRGDYDPLTNTITLYLRNIFVYDNEKDNVDELLAALIHETVHLIHFGCLAVYRVKVRNNIKHSIILESYASYMEYIYLHDKLGNYRLCDDLYKSWENCDMEYFPYVGGLYLFGGCYKYYDYINIRHLLDPADRLFADSLMDMNIAYEDMIMFKRLYEINRHYGRVII